MVAAAAAILILLLTVDNRTEVERLESETIAAARKLQALNSSSAPSPLLVIELVLRSSFGKQDARNHYMEQFDLGINQLLQLGVLEKRSFAITDTNLYNRIKTDFQAQTHTNPLSKARFGPSLIEMTMRPPELKRWEEMIRNSATNASAPAK